MIRKFIEFAIDRPALNHILFVLLLIMALFAYKSIPKEIFPPAELDKISIIGGYAGTSADVLDKMAVKSIEDGLESVNDLSNVDSVIQNGSFRIVADIRSGADNQLVLGNVKDVISNTKRDLPADMSEPVAKVAIYNFPLLLIAISGDVPKQELVDAADALKSRLGKFKDLSSIDIRGYAKNELKINIKEEKLKAMHIPRAGFYQAISNLSSIYPAGSMKENGKLIYLSTNNGELDSQKLADTLLSIDGKRVRLGDVADIKFGLGDSNEISHFNGKRNISINTTKTAQGNAILLSKQIKKVLNKEFITNYPRLDFQVYTDTSLWIKNRINLVSTNIFFGLILVFLAMFLSVNWRIATVVALGIPTSFFIALIAADMLGYSMNMLTMLGALISLGMIVDEAIVVAENIYRHMEMGKNLRDATIDGASEMFPAVLTATATTIFAFLPLLIMSGQIGMFVKVLPVMISILLLSSLLEAFYFLPLHSKELFNLKSKNIENKQSGLWKWLNRVYSDLLSWLLGRKKIALFTLVVSILIGTYGMTKILKFQLFPTFDASQIYISGKVGVNHKLEETEALLHNLEEQLIKNGDKDNISSITSIVGIKFNPDQTLETGDNLFHIFINLHERRAENLFDKYINPYLSLEYDDSDMTRKLDAQDIEKNIEENIIKKIKLTKDSGGALIFKELSVFVPQTGVVKNDIEVGFIGVHDNKTFRAVKEFQLKLEELNTTTIISNNAIAGPSELKLKINSYGTQLGFTEPYLINALRGTFLDAEYGKMFDNNGLVRIRIGDAAKDDNYDIKSFEIATPDGRQSIALGEITDFIYKSRMLKLYKEGGERVWSVSASLKKGKMVASEVMEKLQPTLEEIKKSGIKVVIKGEEKENKRVQLEMGRAAVIALFLIFISLVLMFNSLTLPLIVLSTIPLSLLGALLGTYAFGLNLSVIGIMGVIGLSGVVVNDGLIMLDFIRSASSTQEIVERAMMRLRPILLTSVTTVLGLMTIMFFASGQSLIVQPMAVSLGFGVAWATILNLIYIPLVYAVIYRVKKI